MIPEFDGAIFSREWKGALWNRFYTAVPRLRTQSELQYSDGRLRLRNQGSYGINPKMALKWHERVRPKASGLLVVQSLAEGRKQGMTIERFAQKAALATGMSLIGNLVPAGDQKHR